MVERKLGLKRGELAVCEYYDKYPEIFQKEKEILLSILKGENVEVEHVGSTAIKGIISKPIIDMALIVDNLEKFTKTAEEKIKSEIYTIKEERTLEGQFLIRKEEEPGVVKCFIHVIERNKDPHINYILFRDYMNNHKDEAKRYEEVKKDLCLKHNGNRKLYVSGKEEYVSSVIRKARIEEAYNKVFNDKEIDESLNKNNDNNKQGTCHGLIHTNAVAKYVEQFLKLLNESEETVMLGKIAARLHDIGIIKGKENHEVTSFEMSKEYLQNTNLYEEDKEVILHAILHHSKGKEITSNVDAALLLADKINVSKDRIILDESKLNEYHKNMLLANEIKMDLDEKNLYINYIVEDKYDISQLAYWPKAVTVPNKVAEYIKRKCIFQVNGVDTDFNMYI